MDILQYKEQTTKLTVKLKGGLDLDLEYRPNYLTGETLVQLKKDLEKTARDQVKKLEAARKKSEDAKKKAEDGVELADDEGNDFDPEQYVNMIVGTSEESNMRERFEVLQNHLCRCLYDIDLTSKGTKVPFDSGKEKKEALELFSYPDLELMVAAISEDLNGEVKKTSTDSSAG